MASRRSAAKLQDAAPRRVDAFDAASQAAHSRARIGVKQKDSGFLPVGTWVSTAREAQAPSRDSSLQNG
jgi:hypothetical protein